MILNLALCTLVSIFHVNYVNCIWVLEEREVGGVEIFGVLDILCEKACKKHHIGYANNHAIGHLPFC
jgi:hypothetical protein